MDELIDNEQKKEYMIASKDERTNTWNKRWMNAWKDEWRDGWTKGAAYVLYAYIIKPQNWHMEINSVDSYRECFWNAFMVIQQILPRRARALGIY